ncbi:MAG: PAS domain S-box protein [Actinomycetota bacterium]
MTREREHATVTDDRTRADVLSRLARLTDPGVDDHTRALDARAALDQLAGPTLLVDLDGTVLDINEQVLALGVDREPVRGRPLWIPVLWDTDDPASTLAPLVEAGAEGRAGQRTIDIGGAAPRPGRVSLTPIVDGDRAVAALLVELRGLADSRETDALIAATTQALAAAEDIFRAVAEHTSDLVCLHDPSGTFTYVSPSVRRLLDVEATALVGTHPVDLAHAGTRDALVQAIQDAGRRGSEPTRFRHRLRHRNGSFRWFETAITPILAPDGAVRQLQSSSRDITEQRETEQSLIKQAFHDELTGLPNKALLIDRMTHALKISARTRRQENI